MIAYRVSSILGQNFVPLVGRVPLKWRRERRAPPLKIAAIGSSGVKMAADRHRHTAHRNKHWQRAS